MGSSGIPYFNGIRIAHSAHISSMDGNVEPVVTVYPRTIGVVLKGGGTINKTINLQCRVIPPTNITRGDLEQFMNTWNETYGTVTGTLTVDENDYLDCGVNNVAYEAKILKNYLMFDVEFALGVQNETNEVLRQLIPGELYKDSRGRPAHFISKETGKLFNIWHNVDIVRNLDNELNLEIFANESKDSTIKFNGGVETITAQCWMKAASDKTEIGWKQTVGAYIYNMMNGPVGDMGTFYLGGNVIENCLWTSVKLVECWPTSARYELTFIVGLQC